MFPARRAGRRPTVPAAAAGDGSNHDAPLPAAAAAAAGAVAIDVEAAVDVAPPPPPPTAASLQRRQSGSGSGGGPGSLSLLRTQSLTRASPLAQAAAEAPPPPSSRAPAPATATADRWRTAARAARAFAPAAAAGQQQQQQQQQQHALLAAGDATSATAANVGLPRFCQPPGLDVERLDRLEQRLREGRGASAPLRPPCPVEEEEDEDEEEEEEEEEQGFEAEAAERRRTAGPGAAPPLSSRPVAVPLSVGGDEPLSSPASSSLSPAASPGSATAATPLLPKPKKQQPKKKKPKPSSSAAFAERDARALRDLRALDAPSQRIFVVDYSRSRVRERALTGPADLDRVLGAPRPAGLPVRWIVVHGLTWDVLRVLARRLKLHPLAVEDATKTPQRVKADYYPEFLYVSSILLFVEAAAAAAAALADGRGSGGAEGDNDAGGKIGAFLFGKNQNDEEWEEHHRRFHGGGGNGGASSGGGGGNAAGASVHGAASVLGGAVSLGRQVPGIVDEAAAALVAATTTSGGGGPGTAAAAASGPATTTTSPPPGRDLLREGPPTLSPLSPMSPRQEGEMARPRRHGGRPRGPRPIGGVTSGVKRLRWWRARNDGEATATTTTPAASAAAAHVLAEQVSMFLTRDGTLVSLFADATGGDGVVAPVLERIRSRSTLLTDAEDASLLLHAVLDTIVDHSLPVVGAYAARIDALERRVLSERTPRASYSKELHLLAGDLAVLRRTMVPTQQLVHKLRGPEPAVPLAATPGVVGAAAATALSAGNNNKGGRGSVAAAAAPPPPSPPPPFISPLARTYLSDVLDHVETVVEDLDALAAQAGDIVGLVFSSISLAQNNSVQLLAVVSALFLVSLGAPDPLAGGAVWGAFGRLEPWRAGRRRAGPAASDHRPRIFS
jgi:Mg2+ and Co2+ transporter CorA